MLYPRPKCAQKSGGTTEAAPPLATKGLARRTVLPYALPRQAAPV